MSRIKDFLNDNVKVPESCDLALQSCRDQYTRNERFFLWLTGVSTSLGIVSSVSFVKYPETGMIFMAIVVMMGTIAGYSLKQYRSAKNAIEGVSEVIRRERLKTHPFGLSPMYSHIVISGAGGDNPNDEA